MAYVLDEQVPFLVLVLVVIHTFVQSNIELNDPAGLVPDARTLIDVLESGFPLSKLDEKINSNEKTLTVTPHVLISPSYLGGILASTS